VDSAYPSVPRGRGTDDEATRFRKQNPRCVHKKRPETMGRDWIWLIWAGTTARRSCTSMEDRHNRPWMSWSKDALEGRRGRGKMSNVKKSIVIGRLSQTGRPNLYHSPSTHPFWAGREEL